MIITLLSFIVIGYREAKAQNLKFLIPDEALLQHAGSIGYFSVGAGYGLFKNDRGRFEVMYGILPESKGGAFSTLSTKFNHRLFDFKLNQWINFYPLNPGAFLSYTINKEFDLTWDKNQYPKSYYYWSEALRLHISFGSEIRFNSSKFISNKSIKDLSLYYEINSNDVYIINYVQNKRYLDITGIFKAGIGLRVGF